MTPGLNEQRHQLSRERLWAKSDLQTSYSFAQIRRPRKIVLFIGPREHLNPKSAPLL